MTTAAGESSGLHSELEGQGLSDEREAERWAEAMGGQGIGDTYAELQTDLTDLGLAK